MLRKKESNQRKKEYIYIYSSYMRAHVPYTVSNIIY